MSGTKQDKSYRNTSGSLGEREITLGTQVHRVKESSLSPNVLPFIPKQHSNMQLEQSNVQLEQSNVHLESRQDNGSLLSAQVAEFVPSWLKTQPITSSLSHQHFSKDPRLAESKTSVAKQHSSKTISKFSKQEKDVRLGENKPRNKLDDVSNTRNPSMNKTIISPSTRNMNSNQAFSLQQKEDGHEMDSIDSEFPALSSTTEQDLNLGKKDCFVVKTPNFSISFSDKLKSSTWSNKNGKNMNSGMDCAIDSGSAEDCPSSKNMQDRKSRLLENERLGNNPRMEESRKFKLKNHTRDETRNSASNVRGERRASNMRSSSEQDWRKDKEKTLDNRTGERKERNDPPNSPRRPETPRTTGDNKVNKGTVKTSGDKKVNRGEQGDYASGQKKLGTSRTTGDNNVNRGTSRTTGDNNVNRGTSRTTGDNKVDREILRTTGDKTNGGTSGDKEVNIGTPRTSGDKDVSGETSRDKERNRGESRRTGDNEVNRSQGEELKIKITLGNNTVPGKTLPAEKTWVPVMMSYSDVLKSKPKVKLDDSEAVEENERGILRVPNEQLEIKEPAEASTKKKKKKKKKSSEATPQAVKKTKEPIMFDFGDMFAKLEQVSSKKKQVVRAGGLLPTQSPLASKESKIINQSKTLAANPLDSTAPIVFHKKEREAPKKKKPSAMRKILTKEREERQMSHDEKPLAAESLSDDETGGEEDTNIDEDSEESAFPEDVKKSIHSRKFREYCDHDLDYDINGVVIMLLKELIRFQDRLYHKDPVKAKAKRRFVCGLREVYKHVKLKRLKCVIVTPNMQPTTSKGGLDDLLSNIINACHSQNVPVVFSLNRQILGKVLLKKVPVSIVGIFYYDGAQNYFKNLMELTKVARETYKDKFEAARKKFLSEKQQAEEDSEFDKLVVELDKPVVELDELVVEHDEPVVEHDEPVLELDEPVLGLDKPVVELDEPVVELDEPVVELDEPVVELDEPVVELDEPVVELDEPVVELDEPVVELDELVLELDKPVVELDEPVVELDKPVVELDKPFVELDKPFVELDEPVVELDEPVVELDELVLELDKPVVELDEPVVELDEPVVELDEPVVELDELVLELDKPVVELDEPVVELDEPIVELHEPVVELDEPVVELDKLVVELDEQVMEVGKPVVELDEPVVELDEPVVELDEQVMEVDEQVITDQDIHMQPDETWSEIGRTFVCENS